MIIAFTFLFQIKSVAAQCLVDRIMLVGDSITAGANSGINDPAYWVGYRELLYDNLIASGRVVDFVGSQNDGWAVSGFDSDHEGYGGWTSSQVATNIYQWLINNPADFILLHIGTNSPSTDTTNVELILDEVNRYEADQGVVVTVVVAQIIQSYSFGSTSTVISAYNQNLATMVAQRVVGGDNLLLVDMENALNYPADLYDGLHPNTGGYAKMATVWRNALEPVLSTCGAPDITPPSQPGNFTGTVVGTSQVDLVWDPSSDIGGTGWVGYRLYRDGVEIATTSLTSYTDTGLSPGTLYNYAVEAYDSAGNVSVLSIPVSVTTLSQNASVIRVNAGGGEYLDSNGALWSADFGFNTGNVASSGNAIAGTVDDPLFQTARWDGGSAPELMYQFAVADGVYQVNLYLSENYVGNAGQRVFDVRMEGTLVLNDVDIYAESGRRDTALVRTALVTVQDGQLNIMFEHQVENPSVNAIEVTRIGDITPDINAPSTPTALAGTAVGTGRIDLSWAVSTDTGGSGMAGYRVFRDGIEIGTTSLLPGYSDTTGLVANTSYSYTVEAYDGAGNISGLSVPVSVTTLLQDATAIRVNVGGGSYLDSAGALWSADSGFNTGNVTSTSNAITGTTDDPLYQTGRWDAGSAPELMYQFTVADGVYQVNLYLSENYVGSAGQRVFDVRMESTLVLNDVDIYAESGGRDTALVRTALVTVQDGQLNIMFEHQVENPSVNAIEVTRIGDITPDINAPSTPTALAGTAVGTGRIDLSWAVSTDTGGSGMAGYRVFRDNIEIGTTSLPGYSDTTGLVANTSYSYTVEAYDGAGNISGLSVPVSVTTLLQDATVIRVNVGGGSYLDSAGALWSADSGFNTGNVTSSGNAIAGTTDDPLFQTGRWDAGSAPELMYQFTVADGVYQVNLYLSENYVGSAGQRVFDVRMEGTLVLNGVDIYAESGGRDRALIRTAQVTVQDGQLNIVFEHQVENPTINAIEIIAQ